MYLIDVGRLLAHVVFILSAIEQLESRRHS